MNIKLGYTDKVEKIINFQEEDGHKLARIIAEHKERYIVRVGEKTYQAEITGNMRFSADSASDFPSVGDWVKIILMDDETALIIQQFERYSQIERQAVGKYAETQVIAANIDYAFVVMAVNQDFNMNRLERYVSICNAGNITPIILLTKADLLSEEEGVELKNQVERRFENLKILLLSIEDTESFQKLNDLMQEYETYCFVGSSGVGKSTIVNYFLGDEKQKTLELSSATNKGRHTTSHRELFVLPNGSIVIDTPGMRELGVVTNGDALDSTFDQISAIAEGCKFIDCTHTSEAECAVIEALESGELEDRVYQSYLKLRKEEEHYSSSVVEKKQKDKELGKIIKAFKEVRRKRKF